MVMDAITTMKATIQMNLPVTRTTPRESTIGDGINNSNEFAPRVTLFVTDRISAVTSARIANIL
jgi:hypothetical protein